MHDGGTYAIKMLSLLVSIYYNYNIKNVMDPDLILAAFWSLVEMDA